MRVVGVTGGMQGIGAAVGTTVVVDGGWSAFGYASETT